ncbi:MAG: ribosome biogenesis GTP-binding protein YihA/YsxC [Myxococcota bacterium]|nr:ribosome biogenesis GTP-binding protein YihA/YsxC [Myxococcota bacterium]
MPIVETKLISTAGRLDKLPEPSLPEVAFAGRSNVGKSSLLNALCSRRNLFKVGKTPGRTRTIVHVAATLKGGGKIFLVDLPGYGFARASKDAMSAWGDLVQGYLSNRNTLHLVTLLVDIRRGPEDEEADLLDFLDQVGVPALLVATKLDRLRKHQRMAALKALRQDIGAPVLGTSAVTKEGIAALTAQIASACGFGPSR